MSIRSKFIELYHNKLVFDELFTTMEKTVENSPWHRESNVLVHTHMVVMNYVTTCNREWLKSDLVGAFAVAFHDVGKPAAEQIKFSEARGEYRSYPGHELISARLWVNWAMTNFEMLRELFPTFKVEHVYEVAWVIEKHLPYELKDKSKYNNMLNTIMSIGMHMFFRVIRADGDGRISDNAEEKKQRVEDWIKQVQADILNLSDLAPDCPEIKELFVLIGPSGSGKSTFTKTLVDPTVFSYDQLRLDAVDPTLTFNNEVERYRHAFTTAEADSGFYGKANNLFSSIVKRGDSTIVVDNINASAKNRKYFIDTARNHNYRVVAVYFCNTIQQVQDRQNTRGDKYLNEGIVKGQYMNIQAPSYGEFDRITVITN